MSHFAARLRASAVVTVMCSAALVVPAQARPQYALGQTVALAGEGGWDYLTYDPGSARLFIAHGTRVEVIDTRTLKPAGAVADTPGVHGIAIAAELGRGFVSAGATDTVVAFDLKTLAHLAEIKTTGAGPDAIVYDRATRRVFSFNGRGRNVTAIDAQSLAVLGTIELDARPEYGASDAQGRVYLNLEDKNSLAVIDARSLKLVSVWPLPGCDGPSGLALNQAARQVFSTCANQVMTVTDGRTGGALGSAPIGEGPDAAAYDAGARLAFASCGKSAEVTAVARAPDGKFLVAQQIATQRGARTMALDEIHHRIFLVTADFGPPPAPTAEHPHPRAAILPGTFRLLVLEPHREKTTTTTAEGKGP